MPGLTTLVTIRTYPRHFESLYPVWWNWGFAPSENKFAKTINLQWSYSIHQRFFFTFCISCACAFICMPAFCFFLLVGMELQFWRQFCVDVCFCVFVSGVGIFVNFIQEARYCFCIWLYAPPAKRLCTFASPCSKSRESVSSRDLQICTFGRDVCSPLNPHWHSANQHNYIATKMEIQHYTSFCNCLCNKSPAESSSPPFSFLEEIFPFGKSRFPPFVFCQLAAARKR